MDIIEITWTVKPKSGITTIELSELGCKSKKDWYNLTPNEQEKRLNKALVETDGGNLKCYATEWNAS